MLYPHLSGIARRIASIFSSKNSVPSRRSYPAAAQRAAMETLETRSLLSAAMNVGGNNALIADGSTVISKDNFTDFGPLGFKFGSVTRTFEIENTGDAQLMIESIKSSSKLFLITANPPATIAAGDTKTFTVTFDPRAAGNFRSTITIRTNDPANEVFTFVIGGQGLNTVINSQTGLQIAVTQQGTGTLRSSGGMHMIMNYSGYLTNGLKFDSSLNPGRAPFEFTLGANSVIQGWEQGLQAMRVGEKRVLIIPPDLGYGSGGQGNIPGNATLIFEVQLLGIDGPEVVVKGDGHTITAGDTTPSVLDLTDFGDIGTSGFINHFFELDQAGVGTLSSRPGTRVISLEGPNADQFRVKQPADNNGTTEFGVRFQPTKAGVSTAIVVVRTNDPFTPEFRFTVRGNVGTPTPPVDLSVLFDSTFALPAQVGAGDEVPIPVQVTNWGWATASGQVKITIRASSDATLDNNDPIIGTLTADINIIKHASTVLTVNAIIPLPGILPLGNYTVFGRIDEVSGLNEVHVDDNVLDSSLGGSTTLKVVATKSDLTASIGTLSPARPVYIPGDVIKVPVKITNTGIRTATAPFTVRVSTSTDATFNDNDPEVTTYTVSEDLLPGKSTTQFISYTVPSTGVPANFFLVAKADFGGVLDELSEANNTAATASIPAGIKFGFIGRGGATTVKFFDTDGTLITASLTRSGVGTITKDNDGYHVSIVGTNQKSVVTINATKTATPGDDGRFTADTFTIGNPGSDLTSIKTLKASEMDMTGDFKISGVADSIFLGTFTGDSVADDVMTIGTPGFFSRKPVTVNIVMDQVSDITLTSGVGIRSLNVGRWRDTNATADKVVATFMESLKVTGSTVGTIFAGDFAAGITLSASRGKTLRAPTLTNVNIAGSITAGTWALSGRAQSIIVKGNTTSLNITGTSIGTLNVAGNVTGGKITLSQGIGGTAALGSYIVGGTVTDSALYSAGNVSSLRFGTVVNSEFFAGVKSTVTVLPVIGSDFTSVVAAALPRIGSIVITGLSSAPTAAVLVNSSFAAGRIGSAILPNRAGTVEDGTAVAPYGFATRIGNVGTYVGPGSGTLYVAGNFSNIPS